jgi:hypothetical protein
MKVKTTATTRETPKKTQYLFKKAVTFPFSLAISYARMTAGKTTADGFERVAKRIENMARAR